jgi:integrase
LPLLGAYTGCRLGELVRYARDIHEIDGIAAISVNADDGKRSRPRIPRASFRAICGLLNWVSSTSPMGAATTPTSFGIVEGRGPSRGGAGLIPNSLPAISTARQETNLSQVAARLQTGPSRRGDASRSHRCDMRLERRGGACKPCYGGKYDLRIRPMKSIRST